MNKMHSSDAEMVEIMQFFYGNHDCVSSEYGGVQHHPHGVVGKLWRIRNPDSVRIGHCFLAGRLKEGDLFLCTRHSGDCYQTYIYVEEFDNCLISKPEWSFGSYRIGDAECIDLKEGEFTKLKDGGRIERDSGRRYEEVDT